MKCEWKHFLKKTVINWNCYNDSMNKHNENIFKAGFKSVIWRQRPWSLFGDFHFIEFLSLLTWSWHPRKIAFRCWQNFYCVKAVTRLFLNLSKFIVNEHCSENRRPYFLYITFVILILINFVCKIYILYRHHKESTDIVYIKIGWID